MMSTHMIHSVLFLLFISAVVRGKEPTERVRMVSKGKNDFSYKGSFNFVVQQFLTLPYIEFDNAKPGYFYSPTFFTNQTNDVKWSIMLHPAWSNPPLIYVYLEVSSLPSDIVHFSGVAECGFIDVHENKRYFKEERKAVKKGEAFLRGKPLLTRAELESKAKELLPGGNLTVQCIVEGVLVYNINAKGFVMPIQEKKETNVSECGKGIATDTFNRLSLFDDKIRGDVDLKSGNKSFKCHRQVLSVRSPLFKLMLEKDGMYARREIVFDMSDEVTAEELEDFVNFMYRGKAINLLKSCRILYGIARRYGIECLRLTCEDVLVGQVSRSNAMDMIKLADQIVSARLKEEAGYCIYNPRADKCQSK